MIIVLLPQSRTAKLTRIGLDYKLSTFQSCPHVFGVSGILKLRKHKLHLTTQMNFTSSLSRRILLFLFTIFALCSLPAQSDVSNSTNSTNATISAQGSANSVNITVSPSSQTSTQPITPSMSTEPRAALNTVMAPDVTTGPYFPPAEIFGDRLLIMSLSFDVTHSDAMNEVKLCYFSMKTKSEAQSILVPPSLYPSPLDSTSFLQTHYHRFSL